MEDLAAHLAPAVADRIDLLLAASPAPEQGLQYFARLRERQPDFFRRLTQNTLRLRYLTAIFTYSRFLSEEILEHPEWLEDLQSDLNRVLDADEFRARLDAELSPGLPNPLDLARFRRRQLLRIVARDVLGFGTLPEVTAELSALADAIVETAYDRISSRSASRDMAIRGPKRATRRTSRSSRSGKLGGEELNYSSDIDLMFLYSANGVTDGAASITNKEFFKRAANRTDGACYRPTRRRACVIASTCACAPKEAWARSASRSTARANITNRARGIGNCR